MVLYYTLIWPLSKLPLKILYILSDALYLLLFKVLKYRKKVVLDNIQTCFPKKTPKQINILVANFYRHLADLIVEGIKGFNLNEQEILNRVHYKNVDVINDLLAQNKKVIFTGAHYNSWELAALATPLAVKGKVYAIYTPLTNDFINQKLKTSRSKTGIYFIGPKEVKEVFEQNKEEAFTMVFLTDQSPSNAKRAHWTTFLGRETGVLFGAEKYAKAYHCAMVYGEMTKQKRGYYSLEVSLLANKTEDMEHGALTELHTKATEKTILKDPTYWLWTHRRWKRKKPAEIPL